MTDETYSQYKNNIFTNPQKMDTILIVKESKENDKN